MKQTAELVLSETRLTASPRNLLGDDSDEWNEVEAQSGAHDRFSNPRRARPKLLDPGERTAKRKTNRVQNAGTVMKEILNVPEDIPRDLFDKARCVILLPSALKAAFVVVDNYGRGA